MPRVAIRRVSDTGLPPLSPRVSQGGFKGSSRSSSSRSTVRTARTADNAEGRQDAVPLTVIDYSEPLKRPPRGSLAVDAHQDDEAGNAFMRSEVGRQLRYQEYKYSTNTRWVMRSNKQIRGSSILILGCGASRHLLSLLLLGPSRVTFVDSSSDAIARMASLVDAGGYGGIVTAEFVVEDAWTFLDKCYEGEYDIVMATKCLGQIYAVDPSQRSTYSLLTKVSPILRDDGICLLDHHRAFSMSKHGRPIGEVVSPKLYALATIAGRFASDVCYTARVDHPDFHVVAEWCSPFREGCVQQWNQYIYRKHLSPRIAKPVALNVTKSVVPVPFSTPQPVVWDDYLSSVNPRPFTGVKRIVAPEDYSRLDPDTVMPKFDGVAGIVVLSGSMAVFVSNQYRFMRRLNKVFPRKMVLAAELVNVRGGGSLIIVVGAVNVADAECDPLDYQALHAIRHLILPLAPCGIFPTGPGLCDRLVDGNMFTFGRHAGRDILVPVDGLNFTIDGRNGHFIKPTELQTMDVTADGCISQLSEVLSMIGIVPDPIVMDMPPGIPPEEVVEITPCLSFPNTFKFVRRRPDKRWPATTGRLLVDMFAAYAAKQYFGDGDVKKLMRLISRW
nr:MAG: methyltransferase [Aspergillus flavus polymycovirus 1]